VATGNCSSSSDSSKNHIGPITDQGREADINATK
jgi:hypothetical protein